MHKAINSHRSFVFKQPYTDLYKPYYYAAPWRYITEELCVHILPFMATECRDK